MVMQSIDEHFMQLAIEQAKIAYDLGEVPVGCIITDEDNNIIATGYNQTILSSDPSAHAEIVALRKAGKLLSNYRLINLNLYVTLEPCCMCSGAMIHSRISNLIYGAHDLKTGACGSVFNIITDPRHNHKVNVRGGILSDECSKILSDFFKERRKFHKEIKLQSLKL